MPLAYVVFVPFERRRQLEHVGHYEESVIWPVVARAGDVCSDRDGFGARVGWSVVWCFCEVVVCPSV